MNNIKAAKEVLRTTSTETTYETVYAYADNRTMGTGVDGEP